MKKRFRLPLFLSLFVVGMIFSNQAISQKRSFGKSANHQKKSQKERKKDRQNSVRNRSFGKGSGVSMYVDGVIVAGYAAMGYQNYFFNEATGEYYFNESVSVVGSLGFLNERYQGAHQNHMQLVIDGKYNFFNVNNTLFFSAYAGPVVTHQFITGIEPTREAAKWLYGGSAGLGVSMIILPRWAIMAKGRQLLYFNEDQQKLQFSLGVNYSL